MHLFSAHAGINGIFQIQFKYGDCLLKINGLSRFGFHTILIWNSSLIYTKDVGLD